MAHSMNYFEFYNIPVSFFPDQSLVRKIFYEKSKAYHPDFYVNEPEEKQEEILQLSTLNNNAFKVLSSPERCLEYVLGLHGLISEGEKYTLPQDFLMEMMEINEALMELEFEPDAQAIARIRAQVQEVQHTLDTALQNLLQHHDREPGNQALLAEAKDIYYRKKYVLRINDSLNKFAP
jgi:molecular chaperone HscB